MAKMRPARMSQTIVNDRNYSCTYYLPKLAAKRELRRVRRVARAKGITQTSKAGVLVRGPFSNNDALWAVCERLNTADLKGARRSRRRRRR